MIALVAMGLLCTSVRAQQSVRANEVESTLDASFRSMHNLTALSYLKTATGYSDKLLTISPDYYDAYVGTGLGKYIVGQKAAPVRWILRIGGIKGDQEQGLKELQLAADRGRFLKPFAL